MYEPTTGRNQAGLKSLCVQLFRSDFSARGQFVRVEGSGGDGGVEAYVVCSDHTVIGLQCKCFTSLKSTQWSQIDDPVQAALHNHPGLTKYLIAVPLDRTPSQVKVWNGHRPCRIVRETSRSGEMSESSGERPVTVKRCRDQLNIALFLRMYSVISSGF